MEARETPQMQEYQFVIKVPFSALDDIQARQVTQGYIKLTPMPTGASVKLQRVCKGKEPKGIKL